VSVSFELSNECLLKLKAREESTGNEVEATFGTKDTPAAVRAKLEAEVAEVQAPPARKRGFVRWVKSLLGIEA
jgi:hypothetical protein